MKQNGTNPSTIHKFCFLCCNLNKLYKNTILQRKKINKN